MSARPEPARTFIAAKSPPEIWFFKVGEFSHVNENVRLILEREFAPHPVRVIDVLRGILKPRWGSAIQALGQVFARYPREVFLRRRKPLDFLLRTSAAFRAVQSWAEREVGLAAQKERLLFTFQTQSLFAASGSEAGEIPHFVYTDHTCLANLRYPRAVNPELLRPSWVDLERTIYARATKIFTTANFARDSLLEDYALLPDRVACVFSGTNASASPSLPSRKFAQRMIFVGIDWERKGGPDLLRAFQQVREHFPEARLRIVGCAPRISPNPNVEIIGRIPLAEVGRHLADSDIFCLPSHFEPGASALVEAMQAGLPVVSTRIGGTPDRVISGKTGELIAPGDVPALAAALSGLLASPERCRVWGEAGRALAAERFTWAKTGARLSAEIRAVLEKKSSLCGEKKSEPDSISA